MPDDAALDPNADPKGGAEGSGGGFKPPSDGSWIPRERFNEVNAQRDRERDRAARLEAELAAERQARATEKPKPPSYTRADLQVLVDEGKLTAEAMEEQLDHQRTERIRSQVLAEVKATSEATRRADIVKSELAKYKEAIPELTQDGSEARGRVQKEFLYLVEMLGEPANTATELKAVRSVFGPSDRVREVTREAREGDPETLGGGGGAGNGGANPMFSGLTQDQRSGFEVMIGKGLYTGLEDPNLKKDIQIAASRSRKRPQARA